MYAAGSAEVAAVVPRESWAAVLRRGFDARGMTVLLIAALNTAIALLMWVEDPRPFWHPFVSVQISGFSIAYCVNAAAPWDKSRPVWRTVAAVAIGSVIALVLIIVVKQYSLDYVRSRPGTFFGNLTSSFFTGLMVSLLFLMRERGARMSAAMLRAEAERQRSAKQALEAQLLVMQAQVEPHFLFNTLASVQYLVETDPRAASRLLAHLTTYLRASMPHLRATTSTLGKEFELAREYLSIMKMRMGDRLSFAASLPEGLASQPFPPNMLISLVENAIRHGVEPSAEGGTVTLEASTPDGELRVEVRDTGRGLGGEAAAGGGIGVANIRERLATLFGGRARFTLEPLAPRGTRAAIVIPAEAR